MKVPRPCHLKKDPELTAKFPETIESEITRIKAETSLPLKLWVQDEARFGLQTIWRKLWGIRGERRVAAKQMSFQNFWLYGAMEVTQGSSEALFAPYVSKQMTAVFITQIAMSDPSSHHIIVWDGAGFHQKDSSIPDNVSLIKLPPYSPELNPQEKLWDILKDAVCTRTFSSLEDLEANVDRALKPFLFDCQRILRLIGHKYDWILKANSSYKDFLPFIFC